MKLDLDLAMYKARTWLSQWFPIVKGHMEQIQEAVNQNDTAIIDEAKARKDFDDAEAAERKAADAAEASTREGAISAESEARQKGDRDTLVAAKEYFDNNSYTPSDEFNKDFPKFDLYKTCTSSNLRSAYTPGIYNYLNFYGASRNPATMYNGILLVQNVDREARQIMFSVNNGTTRIYSRYCTHIDNTME